MRTSWVLLCVVAGCGAGPYQAKFSPVDSDGSALRDQAGRALILRGVNARVDGVFDVNFTDGRAPRETIPSFDASDVAQMRESGFNLIRLPIDWSGIEPMPGQYDSTYLDKVQAVVDLCRGSGIYVLLDFHEDGYSKEICEDGAPLWAIDPPPAMLVGGPGPLDGPSDCHTASAALAAFASFFADDDHLQESYVAMAQQVAMRFAGDQQVLGYEVMNEPIGDDDTIAAFSAKVAAGLRAADAGHLILFEPSATRNFTNAAPFASQPFSVDGAVYAVHVYNPGADNAAYPTLISGSVAGAREEAQAWGTPLMITEFGQAASQPGADWISSFLDDADAQLASSAQWLWKEQSQGEWGLFTLEADGTWTPRPLMFQAASRPYPQAIGGDVISFAWDGAQLSVAFRGHGGVAPTHTIFWNQPSMSIVCDGVAIAATSVDADAQLVTVTCGGDGDHTLTLQ